MYVLYLHSQIFLWVCSRMIISAHVQAFTCMWRPEIKNRCLHQSLPTFVFETEPLREVGAHLFAGLWAAGTCHPCTPNCGISRAHHHPSSGLHACAAGTLPAEPSPSSSFRYAGSLQRRKSHCGALADLAALKVKRDPFASASQVPRLKVSTATKEIILFLIGKGPLFNLPKNGLFRFYIQSKNNTL